ncbi:hypothetical protein [Enterobacter sp. SA187]
MNRCLPLDLPCRPAGHLTPATCISSLQSCRCLTHLGASQDSRAGKAL